MEQVRIVTADRGDRGRRLDLVLRRHMTDLRAVSRTSVQRWIAEGLVMVNGSVVTRAAARTSIGDVVRVSVPLEHQPRPVSAEPLPLVVEVWLPSTGRRDLDLKLQRYREQGHAEIWFIHPFDRTLTAWRLQSDGTYSETVLTNGIIRLDALPGVTIDLDLLFD